MNLTIMVVGTTLEDERDFGVKVVQTRKNLPYKVRVFVAHLRQWFEDAGWKR